MSSSRLRNVATAVATAALVALVGCGRTPEARETELEPPPAPPAAAVDAAVAIETPPPPVDAPMPTTPSISAEDQRALDEAVAGLSDEHRSGWGPAMKWLIDHPDLSRARVAAIVDGDDGNAADMAVGRAATVLGEIGNPDDVPVLVRAHLRGGELRSWDFAQALALHKSAAALEALVAASAAEDPHVARSAVGALGTRKDEGGRAALEAALDHESSGVRYTAVLSIIDLGAKKSRAALQARKKVEKDPDVRGALRKALGS